MLAYRARALVPAGEREAHVTAEVVELPAQVAHAGPHVALVVARRPHPEEDRVDDSQVSGSSCVAPIAPTFETTSC